MRAAFPGSAAIGVPWLQREGPAVAIPWRFEGFNHEQISNSRAQHTPQCLMGVDWPYRPALESHQLLMGLTNTPSDLLPAAAGRRQLAAEHGEFDRMVAIIQRVLTT